MTAYQGQLDKYRQILVHNQGDQTQITLQSSRPGQQQSQGSGLRTGQWTAPPSLFKLDGEFVLRLEGREGQTFVEISPGGVQTLNAAPSLVGAQVQPLQPVEPPQTESMKPMEPMKPMRMQMGDMMMDMDSGQMSMGGSGGMQMSSGGRSTGETTPAERQTEPPPTESKADSTASKPRFCSQCGTPVKPEDRFCAQCGHKVGA